MMLFKEWVILLIVCVVFCQNICKTTQHEVFIYNNNTLTSKLILINSINVLTYEGHNVTKIEFPEVPTLQELHMSQNTFQNTENILIEKLTNLKIMNLSYNHISIAETLNNTSLETLDLSHCKINFLNTSLFQSVPSIKSINLSFNPIYVIEPVLSNKLEVLDLSNCNIKYILGEFNQLTALRVLNVSLNKYLTITDKTNISIKELRILDMSQCNISDVNISNVPNIEELSVRNNNIREISEKTFERSINLKRVDLSQNLIKDIFENSFEKNSVLVDLNLSQNKVSNLSWTKQLSSLMCLNLSRNMIDSLSDLFLENVVSLDLSENLITLIPSNISRILPKVINVTFAYNNIGKLSNMNSSTIELLSFEYCNITTIQNTSLLNLTNLKELNLRGNYLKVLDDNLFRSSKSLKTLKLSQNPWECNCYDKDFIRLYVYVVHKNLVDNSELVCVSDVNQTWFQYCNGTWGTDVRLTPGERKTVMYIIVGYTTAAVLLLVLGGICLYLIIWNRQVEEGRREEIRRAWLATFIRDTLAEYSRRSVAVFSNIRQTPPPPYDDGFRLVSLHEPLDTEEVNGTIQRTEREEQVIPPLEDVVLERNSI